MYPVSEVAKKLGVSRQSVYNRLDKKELQEYIHLTEKGKMISSEGVEVLKGLYSVNSDSQQTVSRQSEDSLFTPVGQDTDNPLEPLLNNLKEQVDYLKSVITEKDKQLSASQDQSVNLTRLLENSQVLLKQHQEKILFLENPPIKEKRSFWDIFKRIQN
jgi:hypothetical protein